MPPRELQQYQQWVGLLQVQYVPDGRGGFFEIIDSESQGGMFAVSAVAAEHLQQCLEGTAAPFDESNTMFADGIQAQDVAKYALCVCGCSMSSESNFQ